MILGLGLGGMCAGIAASMWGASLASGLLLLVCGLLLLCFRRWRLLPVAGFLALSAGGGIVTAVLQGGGTAASLSAAADRVPFCSLRGRVIEHVGALGTLLSIDRLACESGDEFTEAGTVIASADDLEAGSLIEAHGWLLPLGDDSFDRARRRAGAAAEWHGREQRVLRGPTGLHGAAAAFRRELGGAVRETGDRESGLLLGLTIGDTSRLDHSVLETFRAAGLAHILAVSGSNVAIVLAAVAWFVRALSASVRFAACLSVLTLYVLVVGPDPSVLRAAVSAVVVLVAFAKGLRARPLNALALALLVLLMLRPQLLFAPGLHLSVSATVGILLWAGALAERLGRLPQPLRLGLAATVTAQAGVAPVLIATFGEISVAGPAANLLALPAVGPATVLGLAAGTLGAANDAVGRTVALAARPFVSWILWVGDGLGRQAWASASVARQWAIPVALVMIAAALGSRSAARSREE